MNRKLIVSILSLALYLEPPSIVNAADRYLWSDSNGEHLTRDSPRSGTIFTVINVPDDVAWSSPPNMPNEVSFKEKPSVQTLFKQLSESVYWVRNAPANQYGDSPILYGSAVAISDELALTNCHVAEGGGGALTIGTGKADEQAEVELVAADLDADRCVLKSQKLKLRPIKGIRKYDALEIGETVYAIGNPLKLQRTLSNGLISGKRDLSGAHYIQFTAPISHGSSGGGLFDGNGNFLGITSLSVEDAQGLNFAIPAADFWP